MKKTTTKTLTRRRTPKVTRRDNPTAPPVSPMSKDDRDIRDLYALAALVGGFNEYLTAGSAWSNYDEFAKSCFNMADVMMRERAKRQ